MGCILSAECKSDTWVHTIRVNATTQGENRTSEESARNAKKQKGNIQKNIQGETEGLLWKLPNLLYEKVQNN